MAHPIPKQLKGEERYFIPFLNIYLNRKGLIYNGIACVAAAIIGKIAGVLPFVIFLLLFNLIAYPLAQIKTKKKEFEGGNQELDKFLLNKFKYNKKGKNIYVRK
jgi:hypothetical protein